MIRIANINDIDYINKLGKVFNSNFKNTYNIVEYLKNPNYIILVNEDECINAFIIVYKNIDYYELEAIIVDNNSRNKGIASNLINYLINCYLKKCDSILLEVAVNNDAAINLYKKFSFKIIHIRKHYYNGIDAYVMKKVI